MQCCTFTVGDLLCGIDVARIREIVRPQPVTPIPLAATSIDGMLNLRGQIVLAIDLRQRVGLPARDVGEETEDFASDGDSQNISPWMNIIVDDEDELVSIVVDAVGDVIEISADQCEPTPPTLSPALKELVSSVIQLEGDQLLLVINADTVFTIDAD